MHRYDPTETVTCDICQADCEPGEVSLTLGLAATPSAGSGDLVVIVEHEGRLTRAPVIACCDSCQRKPRGQA